MTENKIAALCCTHGRFTCLKRVIRCFMDQTYTGPSLLFICNSGKELKFSDELRNYISTFSDKRIYIFNIKESDYNSVGEKYNIALQALFERFPMVDVVTSFDDDDIFLPNHLSEGNKGIEKAYSKGKLAYKPKLSYFRYRENGLHKIAQNENTYETSIFVDAKYLKERGFAPVSIRYHQQWLDLLTIENKILVDTLGESTLVYNWGDTWDTYKMSGSGIDNQNNFDAHKRRSLDMGNGILIPSSDNSSYYKEISEFESNKKN